MCELHKATVGTLVGDAGLCNGTSQAYDPPDTNNAVAVVGDGREIRHTIILYTVKK